jgi:hypothetical protein
MNERAPCVSTTQRMKDALVRRLRDVGLPGRRDPPDHPLAEPESRAGQALAHAAPGDVAQLALTES